MEPGGPPWRTSWWTVLVGAALAAACASLVWSSSTEAAAFRAETRTAQAVVTETDYWTPRTLTHVWASFVDHEGRRHDSVPVEYAARHEVGDRITVEYSSGSDLVVEGPAVQLLTTSAHRYAAGGGLMSLVSVLGFAFPAWLRHLDRRDGIDPPPEEEATPLRETGRGGGRLPLTTPEGPPPGPVDLALRDMVEEVLATRPPGVATVEHGWGPVTGMWMVEVVPRTVGAEALLIRYDGVARISVTAGNRTRRFDVHDLARVRRVLERVISGRGPFRKSYEEKAASPSRWPWGAR